MRIGFDAKRAFLNHTGLGNYSRTLIRSLLSFYPEHQYFLYAPKLPLNERTEALFHPGTFHRCAPRLMPSSLWRSRFVTGRLKKDKLDIYHGLSHELPVGISKTGIPAVVTIHDLIFLRFPDTYPFIDRKIYRAKVQYACEHADKVIAISKQTKRDIIQYTGIAPEKIVVLYQSCSETFRAVCSEAAIQAVLRKYQLPDRFLLNVGTVEPRKNVLLLAKALKYLPEEIKCVVVGKQTPYFKEVNAYLQKEGLSDRMLFLTNLPFSDLPALYQAASVFVYPSRFEGFGIPVLEALCSGTPVVAATGSCLEEAGGADSLYIDPDDEQAWAAAVLRVWSMPALAQEMKIKGKAYAENFTQQHTARQLMELYHEMKQ